MINAIIIWHMFTVGCNLSQKKTTKRSKFDILSLMLKKTVTVTYYGYAFFSENEFTKEFSKETSPKTGQQK